MAMALYEPGLGYYARGTGQTGRGGDFFTSVSVGPLFGRLLARRFLKEWEELGLPDRWRIVECGAHDGQLALDILEEVSKLNLQALRGLEYVISEPLPILKAAQETKLADAGGRVKWVDRAGELSGDPLPGIAFGNELLDALPFHVVEWREGRWHDCLVREEEGSFLWQVEDGVADEKLALALEAIGSDFPEGYRTEVRTNFEGVVGELCGALSKGLLLWPDYGFARPEYYLPDRKTGTLRTFSKHQAAEDPLERPGEMDITAHVDFTAVAEVALGLGCQPVVFRNQGSWLTETAREWLLEYEKNPEPALLRQFQTLVHPAHLGGSFHILELAWNRPERELSPADRHRLALRACPGAEAR